MQVHQVERNSTLQVRVDLVHRDHLSDIKNPAKRDIGFGDSFVDALVLCDPLSEIRDRFVLCHTGVVGIAGRCFEGNVGCDGSRIIAVRLEEDELEIRFMR